MINSFLSRKRVQCNFFSLVGHFFPGYLPAKAWRRTILSCLMAVGFRQEPFFPVKNSRFMPPFVINVQQTDDYRDAVHRAVQVLSEGGLAAFPTETIYGIAAGALDETAVMRLIEAKGRASSHPFALAVKSEADALDYAPNMSPAARRLARRCWPGPLTLVLKNTHSDSLVNNLPEGVRKVIQPGETIGLRVPAHDVVLDVLHLLAGPLVLTSANFTGSAAAVTAEEVIEAIGDSLDIVLDDGRCQFARPSTVVMADGRTIKVLRPGVISDETVFRLSSLMISFGVLTNSSELH